jgi:PhzF family phenazine biosynthesis protein
LWHLDENRWQLRWFTPACEIKLCGHATLASAHVLAQEMGIKESEFLFLTLSGTLSARVESGRITLTFPKIQCEYLSKVYLHELGFEKLGLNALDTYRAGEDFLIHLGSEEEVINYEPDFTIIAALAPRGLIITAASASPERHFVSRFFAPAIGINEDPVTGSAHCSLAVFWQRQLGKSTLRAEQLSKRGGIIDVRVNEASVDLIGKCFTFAKGRFR